MPQPVKYEQNPQLTRLIDWEYLGLRTELADTAVRNHRPPLVAGDRGLPNFGSQMACPCLSVPSGIPLVSFQILLWMMGKPSTRKSRKRRADPVPQPPAIACITVCSKQCLDTLHSAGFPSVDSFALAYYNTHLSHSPQASSIGLQEKI